MFLGDFPGGLETFDRLHHSAVERSNAQHEAWGLFGQAQCLVPRGRLADAIELLEDALAKLSRQPDAASEIIASGVLARALWMTGQADRAITVALRTSELIGKNFPRVFSMLDGYAGPTEVFISAWARYEPEGGQYQRAARRALKQMGRYVRLFGIGKPRLLLLRGHQARVRGQPRKAQRLWRQALAEADRLNMDYDALLAAHALSGEHGPQADRVTFEARANSLSERLMCPRDVLM